MDVEPEKEKEFNDWYDKEHIPALLKVPGVIGASRYISVEGTPKYTAIYELEKPDIIHGEEWKKAVEMTPRPKDVVTKNAVRNVCERISPRK
jgi:antibiotic biosynthesis monooxygenase (ABM) superfamily enzyme